MLIYKGELKTEDKYLMPFMFFPTSEEFGSQGIDKIGHVIVVVAFWCPFSDDYRHSIKKINEVVGSYPQVPSIDGCEEIHRFESEHEALLFIKNWWTNAKIYPTIPAALTMDGGLNEARIAELFEDDLPAIRLDSLNTLDTIDTLDTLEDELTDRSSSWFR